MKGAPGVIETATGSQVGSGESLVDGPERPVDAVLARLHLRGGLLALARAELERMAGEGALDRESLADLAEARWRSGDRDGAAEAAQAHLDGGGSEPIPQIIQAEALFAAGQVAEAQDAAARVLERMPGHLDRLFAGEPHSSLWPASSVAPQARGGSNRWLGLAGGMEIYAPDPHLWRGSAEAPADSPADDVDGGQGEEGAGGEAGETLAVVERLIEAGQVAGVAERLALLLRSDPGLAAVILSTADRALAMSALGSTVGAALHIVRGDTLRSLHRATDAAEAYRESLRAIEAHTHREEP